MDVDRLVWDEWNVGHIARHAVTPDEVEEVCHGEPITRETYAERIIVIGPTAGGRLLAVILDPEGDGVYYPVTARPASRKEHNRYHETIGGETQA